MKKKFDKMTFDTYKDPLIWKIFITKVIEPLLTIIFNKKQTKINKYLSNKYSEIIKNLPNLKYDKFESHNEWKSFVNNIIFLASKKNIRGILTWKPILSTMNVTNSYFLKYEYNFLKNTINWKKKWEKLLIKKNNLIEIPFIYYPKSTGNFIHHGYLLERFINFSNIDFKNISYIFEFGGGYGALSTLIHRLGFSGKYFIYDFELFSQLQKYFFESEGLKINMTLNEAKGIYCYSDLEKIDNLNTINGKKTFIATWSISEAPINIRNNYIKKLSKITNNFDYFIIGYQNNFGEVDNNIYFDDFKKTFKNINWYKEEIPYLPEHNLLFGVKNNA